MPMSHTRNPYQKTCIGFLQVCHANWYQFFQYRNLVRNRTVFYLVQETSIHVTKMTSTEYTDWSDDRQLCVVCCFYCFKMNWGDSSIEKWIQIFCFQFRLVRKKLSEKWCQFSDNGFRYQFLDSGACMSLSLKSGKLKSSCNSTPNFSIKYLN